MLILYHKVFLQLFSKEMFCLQKGFEILGNLVRDEIFGNSVNSGNSEKSGNSVKIRKNREKPEKYLKRIAKENMKSQWSIKNFENFNIWRKSENRKKIREKPEKNLEWVTDENMENKWYIWKYHENSNIRRKSGNRKKIRKKSGIRLMKIIFT